MIISPLYIKILSCIVVKNVSTYLVSLLLLDKAAPH